MEYILREALLHKVSDSGAFNAGIVRSDTLLEFIKLLEAPQLARYIRNLSNMYVLVGSSTSDSRCLDTDKRWSDLLSSNEDEFMKENDEIILGFMLMSNTLNKSYHTIDYIWTRDSIRGKGVARRLIEKYEFRYDVTVVPEYVASPFWTRYFNQRFGIKTQADLIAFKHKVGLYLRWELIEEVLSEPI